MRPSAYGEIDERSTRAKADPRRYLTGLYKEYYAPVGDYLVVHPHQFVLAQTLEYVRLPRFLMAYVVGRSTWGRLGLITATAIGVHPLFSGNLTLEIRNLGETPLRLYPGESIAQLFFHSVDNWIPASIPPSVAATTSRYTASVDPIPRPTSIGGRDAELERIIDSFEKTVTSRG